MDYFSGTDDVTNLQFSRANRCGAISGLVNCDPRCRITMYHVNHSGEYTKLNWMVDDGMIPEDLLALRFNSAEEMPIINKDGYIIDEGDQTEDSIQVDYPGKIGKAAVEANYTMTDAIRDIKEIINKLLKI